MGGMMRTTRDYLVEMIRDALVEHGFVDTEQTGTILSWRELEALKVQIEGLEAAVEALEAARGTEGSNPGTDGSDLGTESSDSGYGGSD
jgi:hypothetical protein